MPFNRNGFPITETELTLIAAAAIMGDNKIPKKGYKILAATGTPTAAQSVTQLWI